MASFVLSGSDIEVRYRADNNELFATSKTIFSLGEDGRTFKNVTKVQSEIGETITVLLQPINHLGHRTLMQLVVPVIGPSTEEADIKGVAIIVHDLTKSGVQAPPTVHQIFDVRPLTGKALPSANQTS